MKDILKGNYNLSNPVKINEEPPSLEKEFEREALKRLGGSIAFVSNKSLLWPGDGKKKGNKVEGE